MREGAEVRDMPTYEYKCTKTGKRFEKFQNITDAPLKTCPRCGGPVKRLISGGAGVIFKGSGFYATDSRASSSAAPSCDRDTPCCGRDTPCDRSPRRS